MSCSLFANKSVLSPFHLISVYREKKSLPTRLRDTKAFTLPAPLSRNLIIPRWHTDDAAKPEEWRRLIQSSPEIIARGEATNITAKHVCHCSSTQRRLEKKKRYRIWFLLCVSKWNTGRGIGHYVRSLRGDRGVLTPARSARPRYRVPKNTELSGGNKIIHQCQWTQKSIRKRKLLPAEPPDDKRSTLIFYKNLKKDFRESGWIKTSPSGVSCGSHPCLCAPLLVRCCKMIIRLGCALLNPTK